MSTPSPSPIPPDGSPHPPLVFRRRYDVPLFWLLLLGGVSSAWGWASVLRGTPEADFPGQFYTLLCVGWLACVAWLVLVVRGEIGVDARGLRFRSLIRRDEIPWADVSELQAVGGFFERPALILRLRRPERFFTLFGVDPCRFRLGLHWTDWDRLVGEILARAPHAQRSEKVRAYLEGRPRVAWRHRLAPLLGSALATALFGYALVEALAWDAASFVPGVLAIVAWGLCFAAAGGAVDWEWRWKSWLVRTGGLLGLAVPSALELAVFLGTTDALVLSLAVCLGWMAATVVLCLPLRPGGRRTAAGYALALVLALVPAWWYGVREPFVSHATGPLTPGPWQIAWSADGRLLYGLGRPFADGGWPMCHVIEAASARVATYPLGEFKYGRLYPAGMNCVLYRLDKPGAGKVQELKALDPLSGAIKLLRAAPWVHLAEGYLSPDRRGALFLAGTRERKEAFVVRLADLSVGPPEPRADLSRFESASWTQGGKMILVECPRGGDSLQHLALWSMAPGENVPTPFHRAAAPFLRVSFSPDARWAIVATGPETNTLDRWEVVDLVTGQARAIDAPLPSSAHFWRMWSPDGTAFGYPLVGAKSESVFIVDPATGKARVVHTTRERDIAFVALSQGGRYVACAVNRELAAQGRIIDTQTGRVTPLRRIGALQPLVWFAWSPNQPTLAVASFGGYLRNERPTILRFYELPP